jgi:hypothetical protein
VTIVKRRVTIKVTNLHRHGEETLPDIASLIRATPAAPPPLFEVAKIGYMRIRVEGGLRMVLRTVAASAALLSILGGCVSQVQLANDKGQTAQCNAAGLGLITAAVAASGQKDCIDRYQSQGYHQVPLSASSAATTSTNGKPQADQCNTYGWGLISSAVAASMQQTCVAGSAAADPASTGQATQK